MFESPDERAYLAHIGELVVRWNSAERALHGLISWFSGGGALISILTAHMTNMPALDALRTLATEFADTAVKQHVLHFIEFFDRVREYRNYYVHGILAVANWKSGEVVGIAQTYSAKGKLTLHQLVLQADEITQVIRHCDSLNSYGGRILMHLHWTRDNRLPVLEQHRSLQEKPPLPGRLKKPRLFLLSEAPQLPPSQE